MIAPHTPKGTKVRVLDDGTETRTRSHVWRVGKKPEPAPTSLRATWLPRGTLVVAIEGRVAAMPCSRLELVRQLELLFPECSR